MMVQSPDAEFRNVGLRVSGAIGATLVLLLIVLAVARPDMLHDMMPNLKDAGDWMRRFAASW